MNRRTFLSSAATTAAATLFKPSFAMTNTVQRRVLWAANVRNKSLDDRLIAATEGGFDTMSIFPIDFKIWRDQGLSNADIRRKHDDAGVHAAIVDPFVQWAPNFSIPEGMPDDVRAFLDHSEADIFEMVDVLGATQINVVEGLGVQHERTALIDALGGFADRAQARGLRLGLEPMPVSSIETLAEGWDLVRAVDRDNLGLTFDTWHFWRSDPDHDLLRTIPGHKIFDVQMVDAKSALRGDLYNDLLHHRLLPGDGDFDLKTTVQILKDIGGFNSVGPELFSDVMDALPAKDVGRVAGQNLNDWL
ncbi:sugar phosphate isomerase/epimerase family protein [uncultured Tateyamaria sp.]|uniref:sugar phosphate isomerase/epimerase family protein n=1 Tax=uncultured Tateyamaria sp. TaxID=455651 RepID=UPI002625C93A|nr:sugar phosphate isomerase/epimerase family protein [uncultured Tateyamaria sp.]